MAMGLEHHYDKLLLDDLDRRDVKAMVVEAENLHERVLFEFADVKLLPADPTDERTIREIAETWLAAHRELAIGRLAPEIVGTGMDGDRSSLPIAAARLSFWSSGRPGAGRAWNSSRTR